MSDSPQAVGGITSDQEVEEEDIFTQMGCKPMDVKKMIKDLQKEYEKDTSAVQG